MDTGGTDIEAAVLFCPRAQAQKKHKSWHDGCLIISESKATLYEAADDGGAKREKRLASGTCSLEAIRNAQTEGSTLTLGSYIVQVDSFRKGGGEGTVAEHQVAASPKVVAVRPLLVSSKNLLCLGEGPAKRGRFVSPLANISSASPAVTKTALKRPQALQQPSCSTTTVVGQHKGLMSTSRPSSSINQTAKVPVAPTLHATTSTKVHCRPNTAGAPPHLAATPFGPNSTLEFLSPSGNEAALPSRRLVQIPDHFPHDSSGSSLHLR